jgi:hypothetical protein
LTLVILQITDSKANIDQTAHGLFELAYRFSGKDIAVADIANIPRTIVVAGKLVTANFTFIKHFSILQKIRFQALYHIVGILSIKMFQKNTNILQKY